MLHERITLGFGIGFIAVGGAMMAEVAKAGAMYSTGLVLIVLGVLVVVWFMLTRQFRAVTQPAKDAYELGFQIGFDRGYLEGRATSRPVVVPMVGASTCLDCDDARRREAILD